MIGLNVDSGVEGFLGKLSGSNLKTPQPKEDRKGLGEYAETLTSDFLEMLKATIGPMLKVTTNGVENGIGGDKICRIDVWKIDKPEQAPYIKLVIRCTAPGQVSYNSRVDYEGYADYTSDDRPRLWAKIHMWRESLKRQGIY